MADIFADKNLKRFLLLPLSFIAFFSIAQAQTLPDATQDFTGYEKMGDGSNRMISPDNFFILSASRNDRLNADNFGAFISDTADDHGGLTDWFEITVNPDSDLGSFELADVFVGEYDYGGIVLRFENVVISIYNGETMIAETDPFSSQSDDEETEYPIDYSAFEGKTIDSFRITFTTKNGTPPDAFNLVNFSIKEASTEAPEPPEVTKPVEIDGNLYASLAEAAELVNNGGYTGELILKIRKNYELDDVISFNPSGTGSADYDELQLLVESGNTLTVSSDGALKIPKNGVLHIENGAEIINNGTIEIASGAFFNNQGNGSPEITFHRNVDGFDESNPAIGEGWRYISSPVEVNLSDFLAPVWTQGLTDNPSSGNTGYGEPNVYIWDATTEGNNHGDWQALTDLNVTLSPGQGVLIYVYADDNYDGQPNEFPKTLSVTGHENAPFSNAATNTVHEGWTLLGNPFATAMDFETLLSQPGTGGLADAVYVWTPNDNGNLDDEVTNSGSWATFTPENGGSGDLSGGLIAPFQAFFVQNSGEASSVEFTNAVKSSNIGNTKFLFKEGRQNRVRLELAGQGMVNSAWLNFSGNGSLDERTAGDAWQLSPMSADYALLATEKPGAGLMDIGHFPLLGDELVIPLVAEATRTGSYTLTVTDLHDGDAQLYLNDLEAGRSFHLEEGLSYEFTLNHAAKTPADPFALLAGGDIRKQPGSSARFTISTQRLDETDSESPVQVALHQNYPNPFNPTTQIPFELPQTSQVYLEVFDMTGRRVAVLVNGQMDAGHHSVTFNGANLSSGVYIYRMAAGGQVFSKRLTLIK